MTEESKLGSGHYEQIFLNLLGNIKFYKFPLIIASIGALLLIISIILLLKNNSSGGEVIFSQESSGSGGLKNNIRIDVEGAVKNPGVYEQDFDSRIADALEAAGGLNASADRQWIAKNLNLAAKLVDGGKIFIPSLNQTGEGKISNFQFPISKQFQNPNIQNGQSLGITTGLVNINSAGQSELEALPGIGPITAGKIISNRPYQTLDELTSRKVVGKAVFEKIKNLISI